jgi:hypothetical protein
MAKCDLIGARWIKSSVSEPDGNCVELITANGVISVRGSKLGETIPILTFTPAQVQAFLDSAKSNELGHLH